MSLGLGGQSSKSSSTSGFNLTPFINEFESQTAPIRGLTLQQMGEALRTGGIGAMIPLISRSVEASRQATSDALTGARSDLATRNLGATPFGQNILANIRLQGAQATNAIAPAMAANIASGAPGLTLGSSQAIIQGLAAQSKSKSSGGGGGLNVGLGGGGAGGL